MNSSDIYLSNHDCFQITYEPRHNLLRLQWRALSAVHQAKDCLLDALGQVQRQQIQRVLLNLDGMPELSAWDSYLLEVSYQLSLPTLPLRQVALVLTSYMQHQTLLEATLCQPSFDIQVFDDAITALEWLRQSAQLLSLAGSEHQPTPAPVWEQLA